jgi:GDP-4-dehydro-6-deoxy-D-mannose reductase
MLANQGISGRIYNVCSGRAYSIREVLDRVIALTQVKVRVQLNPSKFRPNDTPVLLGDSTRIRSEIGWTPQVPLNQTLSDLLDYWRQVDRE